jgi:signal transduction histidine kinase
VKLRVLLVEDSDDDAALVLRELQRAGYEVACHRVQTREAFKSALAHQEWDVILSDHVLPTYDGMTALADVREAGKDIPFILVSGSIGEEHAVSAMKAGAQDYVLKFDLTRLSAAVEREVREMKSRAEQRRMREWVVISERMASAGTLAAGVAHEINNPLAVAYAGLEFVEENLSQLFSDSSAAESVSREWLAPRLEELGEPLRDAREALQRIRDIVRDVKLFSRPNDDKKGPTDVHRVIESSIRMAWNELRHRARVLREFGEIPLIEANEARLGQVVLNLLVNAAQALPEGRANDNEIRVVTRRSSAGKDVIIEVRDSGAGIRPEDLESIFDPFFTTKPVGIGTGLGLAICHRIVRDLGGAISVESALGKGSVFRVSLPAPPSSPANTNPPIAQRPPAAEPRTKRVRVLVVDDEPAITRGVQRLFAGEHDVTTLGSGREALARITGGERFDVIFCDLLMPEVTGMELHAELVRVAPDQARRMVFLTAGAFTPRGREFLNEVENLRIEKPFDVAALEAALRTVAAR